MAFFQLSGNFIIAGLNFFDAGITEKHWNSACEFVFSAGEKPLLQYSLPFSIPTKIKIPSVVLIVEPLMRPPCMFFTWSVSFQRNRLGAELQECCLE